MEKQISAVDWIVDFFESGVSSVEEWKKAKEQANKMFEKQIIKAYETAMEIDIYNEPLKIGKDYYNENFKQND
jgi:hypothetical protein